MASATFWMASTVQGMGIWKCSLRPFSRRTDAMAFPAPPMLSGKIWGKTWKKHRVFTMGFPVCSLKHPETLRGDQLIDQAGS